MVNGLNLKHFKARDIKKILDVDKNKLFYWIRTYRLLKPEIAEASGIGTRSIFSLKNLLELATIKELLKFRLNLDLVKMIKDQMDMYMVDDNRNIFDFILSKDLKEAKFLYIYIAENEIRLDFRPGQIEPDHYGGVTYSADDAFLDPGVYSALRLELGMLAEDLMNKVNQL